jgi:hypothetical protein
MLPCALERIEKAAIGFAVRTFGAASTQGGYDA